MNFRVDARTAVLRDRISVVLFIGEIAMKKYEKMLVMGLVLVLGVGAYADYATITLDGNLSDWSSISTKWNDNYDPGAWTSNIADIGSFGIANDDTYLYVMFDFKAGVLGASSAYEYAIVYIDADNNPDTASVGDNGKMHGIGAEYAIETEGIGGTDHYDPKGTNQPDFTLVYGICGPNDLSGVAEGDNGGSRDDGVYATKVEMKVPLANIGNLGVNDTVKLVFKTQRSGDNWYQDVGNPVDSSTENVTYTIAAVPEPATMTFLLMSGLASMIVRRK